MSIQPGATLGPYRIIEQVGRGGMATVYKAYQPALARYVAIKVLPPFFADEPTFRERFQHEAIAVAGLRHSNILVVFDYGEASGISYLVSEFVEGGTLAGILGKPLPLDRVTAILGPIASALDFAHERGVLHRDIKPSNILLAGGNMPVLSDFGLAKMMGSFSQLTMTGMAVGTPEYMAPEQADGGDLGPSADNYALGVVAYEMLTGRIPFSAETPLAVLLAHLHKPLPLPRTVNPALSEALEEVLLKGLAKAPEDRYVSATNFVEALVAAGVAGIPPHIPPIQGKDSAPVAGDTAAAPSDAPTEVDGTSPSGISASRPDASVVPALRSADVSAGATSAPKRAPGLSRRAASGIGLVGVALLAVLAVAVARFAGDSGSTNRLVAVSDSPTALSRETPVTSAVTSPTVGGNVVLPTATAIPTPLPAGRAWTVAGSPPNGTRGRQVIELKNGRILFAGGLDSYSDPTRQVELYEPVKGLWSAAAPMHEARVAFTTVLLANGDVLAEGGEIGTTVATSAEVYDPRANRWTVTRSMHMPRRFSTATLLENGDVLFVGGEDGKYQPLAGAELYRPSTGVWKIITAPAFTE